MLTKCGIVTAAKMTGTVTVTVHRRKQHPLYRKSFRVSKKFLADAHGLELGVGDEVLIAECRPLSRRKRFRVVEILKQAPRVGEIAEETGLAEAIHPSTSPKNATSIPSDSSHSTSSGPSAVSSVPSRI